METIFRVDVIERGFECGFSVWAAGRKEHVSKTHHSLQLLSRKKNIFVGYKCNVVSQKHRRRALWSHYISLLLNYSTSNPFNLDA